MYKVMTPGPTQVRENVRTARSLICTNPDIDESFVEFYHDTCKLISSLLYTDNETLILSGEGILGLEAACATLTETGDKVLVIDNGIYGRGFADFVTMYGGQPALYTVDYSNTIDVDALEAYLKENHDLTGFIIGTLSGLMPLMMPYNIGKYGDLYYFNQKDEKARQEQLEAILNVDKDELLEIAKEIDETLEKGGICIIGGKNQIDQCDLDEVISL